MTPFGLAESQVAPSIRLRIARVVLALILAVTMAQALFGWSSPALAITAPELRGQRSLQDLDVNMRGRNLKEQEFIKADLADFDLSDTDLRGAVFNTSNLRGANLKGANMENVVAFASHFEGADLGGAVLRNAMLMQSRFREARIEGADFSGAVLDRVEQHSLCTRASGTNPVTGVATQESLDCPSPR